MQVTKIAGGEISYNDIPKPTNDDMQKEYNYILAGQFTMRLLEKGLISEEEYDRIMEKNRLTFSPFESRILRSNA